MAISPGSGTLLRRSCGIISQPGRWNPFQDAFTWLSTWTGSEMTKQIGPEGPSCGAFRISLHAADHAVEAVYWPPGLEPGPDRSTGRTDTRSAKSSPKAEAGARYLSACARTYGRPHHRHVAFQDVEQLGHLVQAGFAQKRTEWSNARMVHAGVIGDSSVLCR